MTRDDSFPDADNAENFDEESESNKRPGCLVKIAVLIVLVAFIAISMPNYPLLLSDRLNFLDDNRALFNDEIVQKCKPAVVLIEASVQKGFMESSVRSGTGFNIAPIGIIVTNLHIVEDSTRIEIVFGDGQTFSSNQYIQVPGEDIAIIALEGEALPYLDLDRAEPVEVGDKVTIIGNPQGFQKISQRGVVTGFVRTKSQLPVMAIDIKINSGNSGSPVINDRSQVVGVIFAHTELKEGQELATRALAIPVYNLPIPGTYLPPSDG